MGKRSSGSPAPVGALRSFPKGRRIAAAQARPADLFAFYGAAAKRINHVGLIKEMRGKYLLTIEGNSNDRVETRRRHLSKVFVFANWLFE